MRVLLDTNVVFSALIAEGNEATLVTRLVSSGHTLVIPDIVFAEVDGVMKRKMSKTAARRGQRIVAQLRANSYVWEKTVAQYREYGDTARALIDEKDAAILAAGLQPEIDYIVSGDTDFTENKVIPGEDHAKIMTPKEALSLL